MKFEKNEKKLKWIRLLVLFFVMFNIISLVLYSTISYKSISRNKAEIELVDENLIDVYEEILSFMVKDISKDLRYLKDSHAFRSYIENSTDEKKYVVKQEWLQFSESKGLYDQIRYIDIAGDEKIRINHTDSKCIIVEDSKLQNKVDRYYFTETIDNKKNEIYVSIIDLNIENDKIETPIKPMMRFAVPVYDGDDIQGIIVLNYFASNIIDMVERLSQKAMGNVFFLNSDGYYLYGGEEKDFAFMYDEDSEEKKYDSRIFSKFSVIKEGSIEDAGFVYIVKKIIFEQNMDEYYLVSMLDENTYRYFSDGSIYTKIIVDYIKTTYIIFICFIISIGFTMWLFQRNNSKRQLLTFATYDEMTGIYNRRAGIERLDQEIESAIANKFKFSICFMDINGLKEVNDNLGHAKGDELILDTIEIIEKNINEDDYVIRLGGDEFLVCRPNQSYKDAMEGWDKIAKDIDKYNATSGKEFIISVSIGVEELPKDYKISTDDIIKKADEKMYQNKREIKTIGFTVLRS